MQDARVLRAMVFVCLLVVVGSGAVYVLKSRPAPAPIVISEPSVPPPPVSVDSPAPTPSKPAPTIISPVLLPPKPAPVPKIFVHVAGAVKNPSLYELPVGCRVMQAIQAAGGAKASADLDSVNLAEKLTDGEKVFLPVKSAASAPMLAPPGNRVGRVSVGLETPTAKATKSASSTPAKPGKFSTASPGTVTLNTATAEELQRLPGVGAAYADRILAYRKAQNGFKSLDELMEVSGIGPKKFEKMQPFLKLR